MHVRVCLAIRFAATFHHDRSMPETPPRGDHNSFCVLLIAKTLIEQRKRRVRFVDVLRVKILEMTPARRHDDSKRGTISKKAIYVNAN